MNTEPKPIYGDGNPETHPLTWRLSKQESVRSADDYEALEGYAGFKKALGMKPAEVLEVIKAATVKVVVVQASLLGSNGLLWRQMMAVHVT